MIYWKYVNPDGQRMTLSFDTWEQLLEEIKTWSEIWEE